MLTYFRLKKIKIKNLLALLEKKGVFKKMLRFYIEYLGINPYQISRRYWNDFVYGETPLKLYKLMASHIDPKSIWVDLGAGRGEGLFFLSSYFGIKSIGVEAIYLFVNLGNKIASKIAQEQVSFKWIDLRHQPIPSGDVYYLAGTCMENALISSITQQLNQIKPSLIFSVSESLIPYGLCGYIESSQKIKMPFGKTTLYIMKRQEGL